MLWVLNQASAGSEQRTIGAAVKLDVHVRTAALGRVAALLTGATKASAAGTSRTTAHKHACLHTMLQLFVRSGSSDFAGLLFS
jgi:hypothetical protein